jgi:hypothetical protein
MSLVSTRTPSRVNSFQSLVPWELPGVHVARVDLGSRGKPDEAPLERAVTPELEAWTIAPDIGGERFRCALRVQASQRQALRKLANRGLFDGITLAKGLAAEGDTTRCDRCDRAEGRVAPTT